ncbi:MULTISPECIES: DUF7302 family protein [unclassified Cedecea]|uniref:DUF7302 family protein n=1 Tax=unclassified Cedecea TaxID=2649846 RepID=UPI003016E9BA
MALVKVISSNIFAGAGLKKVEAGSTIEVSEDRAASLIAAGLAEEAKEKQPENKAPKKA